MHYLIIYIWLGNVDKVNRTLAWFGMNIWIGNFCFVYVMQPRLGMNEWSIWMHYEWHGCDLMRCCGLWSAFPNWLGWAVFILNEQFFFALVKWHVDLWNVWCHAVLGERNILGPKCILYLIIFLGIISIHCAYWAQKQNQMANSVGLPWEESGILMRKKNETYSVWQSMGVQNPCPSKGINTAYNYLISNSMAQTSPSRILKN